MRSDSTKILNGGKAETETEDRQGGALELVRPVQPAADCELRIADAQMLHMLRTGGDVGSRGAVWAGARYL